MCCSSTGGVADVVVVSMGVGTDTEWQYQAFDFQILINEDDLTCEDLVLRQENLLIDS